MHQVRRWGKCARLSRCVDMLTANKECGSNEFGLLSLSVFTFLYARCDFLIYD